MIGATKRVLRRFAARQTGSASVEFVIYLPLVLVIFMSTFEIGLLMSRSVMLERAVDIAMRDLRLGRIVDPNHDKLKARICDEALILPDCSNTMKLELRPIDTSTWDGLSAQATCVERGAEIQPVTDFIAGSGDEMMLVRACVVLDPLIPGAGLGLQLPKDASGGYQLLAMSAFVNEP